MNRLTEMTWPETAQAVAAGRTTVILPLGATEQHGPHLPLGVDTYRATALAERLAEALPRALIAPTLPLGCSDEHNGFPGLLGLGHAALTAVVVDCARRLAAWGVQRLILLSAHGGNAQALTAAVERLARLLPGLQVDLIPAGMTLSDSVLALARRDGIAPEAVGLHAGEGETSEMLHLQPRLVRRERLAPGYCGDMAAVLPRLREVGLQPVTANGVLGDPRQAEAERGGRYLTAQVEEYRVWLEQRTAAVTTAKHTKI